jgi:phospholipase/carboxylesterase
MKKGFEILRNKKDFSIELIPENSYYSLIWLHGLGDSSDGFFSFFQFPESPVNHGCRVKLLQAPRRASSINGGMKMNSWYDIKTFDWTKPDKELYSLQ